MSLSGNRFRSLYSESAFYPQPDSGPLVVGLCYRNMPNVVPVGWDMRLEVTACIVQRALGSCRGRAEGPGKYRLDLIIIDVYHNQ